MISDGAIFAVMPRVSKVILGTHAVMANGGLIAHAGAHLVALAASQHSVPLLCVTGLYKLCPLFPYDQETFNDLRSPGSVLAFEEIPSNVSVVAPAFDYVPPELVSLLITNQGGYRPSYIYRLLSEFYCKDDTLTECTRFA